MFDLHHKTWSWVAVMAVAAGLSAVPGEARGQTLDGTLYNEPVRISGAMIYTWPEGPVRVFVVVGSARVQQGENLLGSAYAVLWFEEQQGRGTGAARCLAYAESGVRFAREGKTEAYEQLLIEFVTCAGMTVDGPMLTYDTRQASPLFARAEEVRKTQQPMFSATAPVSGEILPPQVSAPSEELEIFADKVDYWEEGDTRVVVATGHVYIRKHVRQRETERLAKGRKAKPSPVGLDRGESYELTAERVVLWMPLTPADKGAKVGQDVRAFYAEGDVTLYRDADMVRAEQMFENPVENRGLMTNAEVRTKDPSQTLPFVLRAKELRELDTRRIEAKDASITTDPYGKPHFKFQGQKMRLVEGKRATVLSTINNTFQIGDLPVAYWPFFSKDLRDDSWMLRSVGGGFSDAFGAFVLTEWDLYDLGIYRNDWSDATLRLDTYTKRGLGIGGNFEYVGNTGFGFVQGYYIHDSGKVDSSGLDVEYPDRGRVLWRDREFLPMDWRFDAEVSYLSDRGFLNEYFLQEYAEGKPQETSQYFRKIKDNAGMTLAFQEKINDFGPMEFQGDTTGLNARMQMVGSYLESPEYDTTAQKFPELGYHQIGRPFFGSWVNYSTDTRFDVVNLQYDQEMLNQMATQRGETIGPQNFFQLQDPPTTTRLDTKHDVSTPFDVGPVRVDPMFSTRVQAESNTLHETSTAHLENDGADARVIAGPQITATTNFWRVYDVSNRLLDINRLKHIITPQVRYENAAIVTASPERFYNFDAYSTVTAQPDNQGDNYLVPVVSLPRSYNDFDKVESMDYMQRIVAELRQRLQTKRGRPGQEQTVDLAELRIDYNAFLGNQGLNQQFKEVYGDYIRADAFWQLTPNILIESRGNQLDVSRGRIRVANIGANFTFQPDWNLYLGQRYTQLASLTSTGWLATENVSENVSILGLEYTVSPKYAVAFVQQYDWTTSQNMVSRVTVSRKLPGWVLDISADVNPINNDNSFNVTLTPIGLRQGIGKTQ